MPDELIAVLTDKTIDIAMRDDAAMDLGLYDEPRALEALIEIAKNHEQHEMILDSCGESIADIWLRNGGYDATEFDKFALAAKHACYIERPDANQSE